MKILYLAHRIPYPPNKGDKIRSFNQVRFLSEKHEVHLLAFCDQIEDLHYAEVLRKHCRSVTLIPLVPWIQRLKSIAAMLSGKPLTLGYFSHKAMRNAVGQKLAGGTVDVILAFSSSMAPYVERERTGMKILDFVDSDATKWAQYATAKTAPTKWVYRYEATRLKAFEIAMLDRFDACVFVSNRETGHLSTHPSNDRIVYVQNGIDLAYYGPMPRASRSASIIFTGAMDYFPNIEAVTYFVEEILFRIRRKVQEAEFLIVGSRPTQAVQKLARVPGVKVVGTVPDVRPFMARAHVAVAPLRTSQGVQNKILEALATGLRVVATPKAAAGLTTVADLPLIVASDAESFADRVCECLRLPSLSGQAIHKCREALRKNYDWTTNLTVLENLVQSAKTKPQAFVSTMAGN